MTIANLNRANKRAGTAMERLSSGLKINSSGDDPAGMAIANKLNSQAKALNQANTNAMDGISMVQTAEGALNEVHSMLNRMRELCVRGKNETMKDEDKEKIQQEIDSLMDEMKAIGTNTQFNGKSLLSMQVSQVSQLPLQIGGNTGQVLHIETSLIHMSNVLTPISALSLGGNSLESIDKAIEVTSKMRGYLGAIQNRLEHTVSNLSVSEENTTASLSRIQDADMAEEMTNYTQYNVISQAGIAMLTQANQRPQQVLQLLNT